MVDIAAQSPSWSGGSPTQYIQAVIDANPAGTTYNLLTGTHRFQTVVPKVNDTIIFKSGAVMTGGDDISGGWTADSTEWYKGPITRGRTSTYGNTQCRSGYECGQLNWVIVDGRPKAWVTTRGAVTADTAWYDTGNSRIYIGVDPTGKTVEIARQPRAIYGGVNNVTVKADDWSFYGIIENYASDAQSEVAAYAPGRTTVPVGSGWLTENIIVRNCSGAAYAQSDDDVSHNVKVIQNGQLGVMGSEAEDAQFRYSVALDNGIGGWDSGWEGGNTKWVQTLRHKSIGSWFGITDDFATVDQQGPIWYDIDNDGYEIYDCIVSDTGHIGKRGIFLEIGWSGKVYRNVCIELSHQAENNGWCNSLICSNSGAVPSSTIYDLLEIYNNIFYDGSGGVKAYMQDRGSGDYGTYLSQNIYAHHNLIVLPTAGFSGFTELDGSVDDSPANDYSDNLDWDYNTYRVTSTSTDHFVDRHTPTPAGICNFTEWQAEGMDTNGQIIAQASHPSYLPDPRQGGCLAAAGGF